MTNSEFREWLRGFFELSAPDAVLNGKQVLVIVNHLNLAEAVETKLDDTNTQLRMVIDGFRNNPVPATPEEFAQLTQDIRELLL